MFTPVKKKIQFFSKNNFARKIKQLRKTQKLTQTAFGQLIAVSKQTINRWETGLNAPDIENVAKIIDVFHLQPDYFTGSSPSLGGWHGESTLYTLSAKEDKLLAYFRRLTAEHQEELLDLAEFLEDQEKKAEKALKKTKGGIGE